MGPSYPVYMYTPKLVFNVTTVLDACKRHVNSWPTFRLMATPIGHLLSSYRSRSPRESAAELASADSYVPESRIPSRSTSVFDDASYASSRVIAAEIHSPPRSISSQMPTASAQPLAQSTQIPQAYQFSPVVVPLAVIALSATSYTITRQ